MNSLSQWNAKNKYGSLDELFAQFAGQQQGQGGDGGMNDFIWDAQTQAALAPYLNQGVTVADDRDGTGLARLGFYDPSGQEVYGTAPKKYSGKTDFLKEVLLPSLAVGFGGPALEGLLGGIGGAGGAAAGADAAAAAELGALDSSVGAGFGGGSAGLGGLAETLPASFGDGFSMAGADGATYSLGGAVGGAPSGAGGLLDGLGSMLGGMSPNTLASLLGAGVGLIGSNKAADAIQQGNAGSQALQKYMYDTTRAEFAPYRDAGTSALGQIQALLKDPSSLTKQPDYQFGLSQGTRAMDNSATSRGGLYSGQQLKASQRFGQDYAGTKLNESYNRLASLAGIGQQATGSTANAGANYANAAGNAMQNSGNASGSAYVGGANAINNALGSWITNNQQEDLLKRIGYGG